MHNKRNNYPYSFRQEISGPLGKATSNPAGYLHQQISVSIQQNHWDHKGIQGSHSPEAGIFKKSWSVAYALQPALETELERMQAEGILAGGAK